MERSFLFAGARSVLATLWTASDAYTRSLELDYGGRDRGSGRRISTKFGWTQQLPSRKEREKYLDENGVVKDVQNSLQNFPV